MNPSTAPHEAAAPGPALLPVNGFQRPPVTSSTAPVV